MQPDLLAAIFSFAAILVALWSLSIAAREHRQPVDDDHPTLMTRNDRD